MHKGRGGGGLTGWNTDPYFGNGFDPDPDPYSQKIATGRKIQIRIDLKKKIFI